jgi:hypothetical protein
MSRPLPHVPMYPREPLATEADVAAMHHKLAEKLKQKVDVQVEAGFDFQAPLQLKWEKPEERSRVLHSVCRTYRVTKTNYREASQEPRWVYRIEKLVEDLWYYRLADGLQSFAEVRKIAQADFEKIPTNSKVTKS